MTTDVRNFNPFHTIMNQVSRPLHIVNVKNSLCLSFQKNGLKELYLLRIKFLTDFLHPPDITEMCIRDSSRVPLLVYLPLPIKPQ